MPDLDRRVAGLRCRDVLDLLGDYVDDELDDATVDRIHAHLRGCDHCEKFGGEYGALVADLRLSLREGAAGSDVRTRLEERMRAVWEGDG